MPSTLTMQSAINWTLPYVHYQPLLIAYFEPALTNANLVKQTVLGAPFIWPWNRAESNPIACTTGVQSYMSVLPDFGFIEKAWIKTFDDDKLMELEVQTSLSGDVTQERPQFIAAQKDDGQGNITFRLIPAPDQPYILTVQYQKKATPIYSPASLWDPIPDELSYIFFNGFLAMSLPVTGDGRFPTFNDRFIAHLLGAQDGLDQMQKNIFLAKWLDVMKQTGRAQTQSQQGTASRGR